jgi:hypothetical protein
MWVLLQTKKMKSLCARDSLQGLFDARIVKCIVKIAYDAVPKKFPVFKSTFTNNNNLNVEHN